MLSMPPGPTSLATGPPAWLLLTVVFVKVIGPKVLIPPPAHPGAPVPHPRGSGAAAAHWDPCGALEAAAGGPGRDLKGAAPPRARDRGGALRERTAARADGQ